AVDASSAVYLVGASSSTDLPHTSWGYQTSAGGSGDAFALKMNLPALPSSLVPEEAGVSAATGVRYVDGTLLLDQADLSAGGFGPPWGKHRLWSNNAGYDAHASEGSGVGSTDLPFLLARDGTNTIVLVQGSNARYFNLSGGTYVELNGGSDLLTHS